jgi:hypothetical protein
VPSTNVVRTLEYVAKLSEGEALVARENTPTIEIAVGSRVDPTSSIADDRHLCVALVAESIRALVRSPMERWL